MTGTRDPQQDGSIQAMLHDAGLEASTALRGSLEELRALVPGRAPAPRADLAALLAAGARNSPLAPASPAVASLADRRRSRKRRLAIVGGAVVAAMSLGAGAVAASSEDFRHNVGQTIGVLFQPAGPAPAPEHARPSPADIPAVPAHSTAPALVPGSTASAAPATRAPGPAAPVPSAPTHSAGTPGVGGVIPTPGQYPVAPGLPAIPGQQGLGEGQYDGNDRNQNEGPAPVMPALPGGVPTKIPGRP